MFRDAGRRIKRNPFNDLPANWWPRLRQKEPDPYTEGERGQDSQILSGAATVQGICVRSLSLLRRHKTKRGGGAQVGQRQSYER
jgi:hypothetical protein